MSKKTKLSSKQELNILLKKDNNLLNNKIPTYKNIKQMRIRQLSLDFLSQCSNKNNIPPTLKYFSFQNNVSESTLRKGIKDITGETLIKTNPNSNNIKKYQIMLHKALENNTLGIATDDELLMISKWKNRKSNNNLDNNILHTKSKTSENKIVDYKNKSKRDSSKRGGAINDQDILDNLMRNKIDELP